MHCRIRVVAASDARIPQETISLDSTLTDLGIDSLEAIEIVFNLEERFKISFPDRDPSFDTGTVRGPVNTLLLDDSYHMVTVDRERNRVIEKSAEFFASLDPDAANADYTPPSFASAYA